MGILIQSVGILIWGFDHMIKYIHKKETDDVEVELIHQTVLSVLGVTFYQGKLGSLEPIKFRTNQKYHDSLIFIFRQA